MKNFKKKLLLFASTLTMLLILSGCVASKVVDGVRVPTEAAKHGLTYKILVVPMSWFVDLFATRPGLALGYGWGIILVTLIIRLIILPLGLNQQYRSTMMQEKTAYLQPVFEPINKRLREARQNKDQEGMMAAQRDLMKAQKDNGINMLSSMGCLPLLIQWPFFIALYNAAAYTPGISSSSFYGINLGHPNIILTILSGVFYAIQTLIMMQGMPEEQRKQQRAMLIMSPAMIIFFSFVSPAGVTLYWVASGLIVVVQQAIVTYIMRPRMKKRIDEEFKKNPPKMSDLPSAKDVTPKSKTASKAPAKQMNKPRGSNPNKKGRNAGKQHK